MKFYSEDRPLIASGLVLGAGMGGFVDGILFHQILQAHNMLSNRLFPDSLAAMEINMVWDGLFHAVVWVATLAGILFLWSGARRASRPKPANSSGTRVAW